MGWRTEAKSLEKVPPTRRVGDCGLSSEGNAPRALQAAHARIISGVGADGCIVDVVGDLIGFHPCGHARPQPGGGFGAHRYVDRSRRMASSSVGCSAAIHCSEPRGKRAMPVHRSATWQCRVRRAVVRSVIVVYPGRPSDSHGQLFAVANSPSGGYADSGQNCAWMMSMPFDFASFMRAAATASVRAGTNMPSSTHTRTAWRTMSAASMSGQTGRSCVATHGRRPQRFRHQYALRIGSGNKFAAVRFPANQWPRERCDRS